jgi:3-oxoacyl-[acyl-carrier protein] reductase
MVSREGCALVTGGSRGIGAATARALAAEGWPVALLYRSSEDAVRAVADEIAAAGGRAHPVQADVADPAEADAAFAAAEAELGPVLVLVNNAGVTVDGLAPQLSDDDWSTVIDTNLTAAFRLTRRALKPMLRARFGRIVNVASIVGLQANPGQSNYAAAKAGLIGMTKTVAAEVARRNITVNAVAPGFIATDMTLAHAEAAADRIPVRRLGTPDEVAACIRFLASEEASYVTGATLVVDGGLSA